MNFHLLTRFLLAKNDSQHLEQLAAEDRRKQCFWGDSGKQFCMIDVSWMLVLTIHPVVSAKLFLTTNFDHDFVAPMCLTCRDMFSVSSKQRFQVACLWAR